MDDPPAEDILDRDCTKLIQIKKLHDTVGKRLVSAVTRLVHTESPGVVRISRWRLVSAPVCVRGALQIRVWRKCSDVKQDGAFVVM